ncbi:hypothetical protein [Methylobacter svalbardensis]|uniref:hypothetical protein n=1 Tax=Methylobacter svalbardensis TaxID=3080016 RepID=UPI0030EC22C0
MSNESQDRDIISSIDNQAAETKVYQSGNSTEAIIRAVAVKHGIALGHNDPILVLHTLNGLLMDEFASKQEVLIDQFKTNLEETADLWSKNMEIKANEILGGMENSHRHLINELIEKHIDNIAMAIADKSGDIAMAQQKRSLSNLKSLNSQLKNMRLMPSPYTQILNQSI